MTPPAGYTEDELVEQPAIKLFGSLGWETANLFEEVIGAAGTEGRETQSDVVLPNRLRAALAKLNPKLPKEALDQAYGGLARERSSVSMPEANREIHQLLKEGVPAKVRDKDGERVEKVRVIDWENPKNNDFFLASQLWITGDMYKRRTDLVGFVNGLPLVFIELKASHKRLEHAYEHNLRDYKQSIPQLFLYNAFIILSNGQKSKIGTVTAGWDHYAEWKKINRERERGVVSLETIIRGTCEPSRLLDLVENFIAFSQDRGGLVKVLAKNHQYLGVNNSIDSLLKAKKNKGRLGVFWHTQGSGKSYSMLFFTQKVLRKVPGNFTFVIVTDRMELDDQIHGTFDRAGAVTEKRVQATDGEHLKRLLKEDHRLVFTLIQKFRTEKGKEYPRLSDRSDVIVITDEAHRTQYDVLALNMRNALPNAGFLGFTGTPLMAGEEKTREVFGDYVSVYNFRQSVEDGATVQLYYENRIPELQLTNPKLTEGIAEIVEAADLDESQEKKLEREFEREYHLVTRDERLNKIAEDLVQHFSGRGYLGKGMVVSIDKTTAVRMHDKVKAAWAKQLAELRKEAAKAKEPEKAELEARVRFMEETDMAVVVSQAQNEVSDFKKKGLDVAPHRKRMVSEDLEEKFKDPKDKLRLVFVCAMWITGFDVPSMSTIYLDKPMRNHTLMQTIARANRVFGDKQNGLIVDYIGVFRHLQKALAIYGSGAGGKAAEGEMPVKSKAALVVALREAVQEAEAFCKEIGIDLDQIEDAGGFERVGLIQDAVDAIFLSDETKRRFFSSVGRVEKLFKAVLPDTAATEFSPRRNALKVIAEGIRSELPEADISEIMADVEALLDRSIATEGYVIGQASDKRKLVDLSKIDFAELQKKFKSGRKHTEAERLRALLSQRLSRMVRANAARKDYLEKFQKLIDEYNAGSMNIEEFFERLVGFARGLDEEEKRGVREGLTEEELAIFDVLTRPTLKLTQKEEVQVKKVAKALLASLKHGKLSLDWRKRQQTRAQVLVTIQDTLEDLPTKFTSTLYQQKCDLLYQHVYDAYPNLDQSVYAASPSTAG